jgi:hypothetical protein
VLFAERNRRTSARAAPKTPAATICANVVTAAATAASAKSPLKSLSASLPAPFFERCIPSPIRNPTPSHLPRRPARIRCLPRNLTPDQSRRKGRRGCSSIPRYSTTETRRRRDLQLALLRALCYLCALGGWCFRHTAKDREHRAKRRIQENINLVFSVSPWLCGEEAWLAPQYFNRPLDHRIALRLHPVALLHAERLVENLGFQPVLHKRPLDNPFTDRRLNLPLRQE